MGLSNKQFYGILLGAIAAYIVGMPVDVMDVDAAQYAEMSREMYESKSFLQVFCLGRPYLDKPPLLFWLNTLSFTLFGINNVAFKLPSVVFALLGIYSTYRLAKLFYTENIARVAAVILATSQALFLITNDVRTDTMLMGAVAFALWQGAAFFKHGRTVNLLWAAFGTGLGLLAKGPIALIVLGLAFVPHLLLKRELKKLLDVRILAALLVPAVMLVPMCLGLYQQWGTQGLRFYFWTQSFGRITGESEWNNHPDTFFLLHTTAWAILPWTVFFFTGWVRTLYALFKLRLAPWAETEFIAVSGFTLTLIALSLSKYQLPHYIYVVFPLAAIMAAVHLERIMANSVAKWFRWGQVIMAAAYVPFAALMCYLFVAQQAVAWGAVIVIGVGVAGLLFRRVNVVLLSAGPAIAFNLFMAAFVFPAILKYQPGGDFGRYIQSHPIPNGGFVMHRVIYDYPTAFYARQINVPMVFDGPSLQGYLAAHPTSYVICDSIGYAEIKQLEIKSRTIMERPAFNVARMTPTFINPATRLGVCGRWYLLQTY